MVDTLAVLRLSRPTLAQQYPLARQDEPETIDRRAALSFPDGSIDESFTLTPLLTLPPIFGAAYVGEQFACTLMANNELPEVADQKVTSVSVTAEMQTPSQTVPLELNPAHDDAGRSGIKPGESLQKIVRYDLREEGSHVLAVNLSYYESILSKTETSPSSGRARSFKKLYQFQAQPCLSVRTKASDLPSRSAGRERRPGQGYSRYALEAQLENLADGLITVEHLTFEAKSPFRSSSLNWDLPHLDTPQLNVPTLRPREVTQVAFLIEEKDVKVGEPPKELTKDGRTILGLLTIRWRSAMGEPGILSTGWLTSRRI
ncbi:hypothetical protein MMC13_005298 [Lambiella insularis]|nr:hypothetical protein [Lambiella insularis]